MSPPQTRGGASLLQLLGRAAAKTVRDVPFGRGDPQSSRHIFQRPIDVAPGNLLEEQLDRANPPAYFRPENMGGAQIQRYRCCQAEETRSAQNAAGSQVFPRCELGQHKLLPVNSANANKGHLQMRGEAHQVVSWNGATELQRSRWYSEREHEGGETCMGELTPSCFACRDLGDRAAPSKVRKARDAALAFLLVEIQAFSL